MARKHKKKKKLGPILLLCISFAVIIFTTFTIFRYWTMIYNKYQEKGEFKERISFSKG